MKINLKLKLLPDIVFCKHELENGPAMIPILFSQFINNSLFNVIYKNKKYNNDLDSFEINVADSFTVSDLNQVNKRVYGHNTRSLRTNHDKVKVEDFNYKRCIVQAGCLHFFPLLFTEQCLYHLSMNAQLSSLKKRECFSTLTMILK